MKAELFCCGSKYLVNIFGTEEFIVNILRIVMTIIALLLAGAHYGRAGDTILKYLFVALPLLLLIRKKWSDMILAVSISITVPVWIHTTLNIIAVRKAAEIPWLRMAIILGGVALFSLIAAFITFRHIYRSRKAVDSKG
ncbi:hypothetical protein DRQ25_10975 [Candidatus Fermentibacteria bacterium]|nr:MAG: hypothetical protein DRQ25_10975 [Candidatus Fermentibacteria bacterium]